MSRPGLSGTRRPGILVLGGALALSVAGSGVSAQSPLPTVAPSCAPAAVSASPAPSRAVLGPMSSPLSVASPIPATSPFPAPADSLLPLASAVPVDTSTPEPDTAAGNAHGDVPDNAVFLTYQDASHGFAVQYVEGWQVTPSTDGVTIRDKDSSETVQIMPLPSNITACVLDAELPALQALDGFSLIGRDRVKVNGQQIIHLTYHLPAPPDPVTGKRVPSTVDRYYVPGPAGLAIVSLSTPDGVDNVDAFRQMIKSLSWS